MSLILLDHKSERRTSALAVVSPPVERGLVLTTIQSGPAIVWLVGEIDRGVAADLDEVVTTVRGHASVVVVDPRRMTSCDLTLPRFLDALRAVATVTIRRPTPAFRRRLVGWGIPDIQLTHVPRHEPSHEPSHEPGHEPGHSE